MGQVDGEPKGRLVVPVMQSRALPTQAIHADDHLTRGETDVAPAMHVSTTFRYAENPEDLVPKSDEQTSHDIAAPPSYVYSRLSAPTTTRFEAVLSSLLGAHALTYTSGLAAFHALLVFLNPRRIAISGGYHGCHGVVGILSKLTGLQKVDLHSEAAWDAAGLGPGDVVHVETPLNPTGEALDVARFAALARARGAYLTVDATFGPPGLQDPFARGADAVMHSGTKYIGGHSDMLCGVLAVRRDDWWQGLYVERLLLGCVMGSFEGWLGLRSARTLELRVRRQSDNATAIVKWLHDSLAAGTAAGTAEAGAGAGAAGGAGALGAANGAATSTDDQTASDAAIVSKTVLKLTHASLQTADMPWLTQQMPNGYGPVFGLWLRTPRMARALPSRLALFHHATSLGGVESLIEWRRMSDAGVEETLLRVSVGAEDVGDLIADLRQGLAALADDGGAGK